MNAITNLSYEASMLKQFKMPSRKGVENALIIFLFNNNGAIKEFSASEEIVEEIADHFRLNEQQREVYLETIYKKENRVKKSFLWHRLLFRAADNLAKEKLVSRPSGTFLLTKRREWMLTEKGFDFVAKLLNIPMAKKEVLPTKSYEVQKVVNRLKNSKKPNFYNPIDTDKKVSKITSEVRVRQRGFRIAVLEAYDYKCAFCGMKIYSPDTLIWEVEAAHIVPYRLNGKDDIWNAMALCHLHHWAFDVGWFTLFDDYRTLISSKINNLPPNVGKFGETHFLMNFYNDKSKILLPFKEEIYPHKNSLDWHRQNIFHG